MDISHHLPALQVVVPLFCAPLLALFRPRGLAWAGATAASLLAFIIAINLTQMVFAGHIPYYEMGSWPAPFGIALRIDDLSAILLLIITGASTVALISGQLSVNSEIEDHRQPLFYAAWLLALAGLSGIVISADAFNIFVFMEISSLASYVIIAGGPDRRALPAVFKYLTMGTIGATFYLIGVGLIYMMTGTLNLADMNARIQEVSDLRPVLAAAGFITIGLALKAAIFPLHVWMPNAYTFAPNAVTVFLAACSTKVSLYILFRFDFIVFQENLAGHEIQFSYFLMPLAVLAILVGSAVALFESNIKRMLAYSSVAQIGYMIMGASLISVLGLTASFLHFFNHALAKAGLFLAVMGLALHVSSARINDMAGIAKTMPWTMAAFVVAGFSLIGIPGTAGFITKWYLLLAAAEQDSLGIALIVVIVAGSLMSVAYIWRVVEITYFKAPASDVADAPSEAPTLLLLGTWLVALANIVFGIFPYLPVSLAKTAAINFLS